VRSGRKLLKGNIMQKPLEIIFHNLEPSPAIEDNIRKRAAKLDRMFGYLQSCRVVVEAPHKHQHKGKPYQVRIEIGVPDDEIIVSRAPAADTSHQDAYVAVRDAFNAATRQLEAYADKRRGQVKSH